MNGQPNGDSPWLRDLDGTFDLNPLKEVLEQLLPASDPRRERGLVLVSKGLQASTSLSHDELQELCDIARIDERSRHSLSVLWWQQQLRLSKAGRHLLGFMVDVLEGLSVEDRRAEQLRLLRRWLADPSADLAD